MHYLGNGYTNQTYNDSSQYNDEGKCGLSRYISGSKFNSTNGTFEHSKNHIYKEDWNLIYNRFQKIGYHFKGWSLSETGAIKYNDQQTVSKLINPTNDPNGTIVELYAKWQANTYTVKYNGNGNTGGSTTSSTHTYGVAKNLTANGFTKTGYTFKGWSTSTTGSVVHTDKKSVTNLTATNGATVNLYAIWQPNTYTVKYDGNGNTGGSTASSTHTYDVAKNLTANGFTKTGYTFKGWSTSTTGSVVHTDKKSVTNLTATNGATINLYAIWQVNTYTVKYNGNGNTGGSTASSTHTYGTAKALTANGFTKTGYTFKGWATSSTGNVVHTDKESVTNLTTTNGATVTLYAVWQASTYTISYNGNGNTGGSTSSSSHTYGVTKPLTANGFTKTGYTFDGWATSASGSVAYTDQQFVSNLTTTNGATITLYAKWKGSTYTVQYNGNGHSSGSMSNSSFSYGTAQTLIANGFTKTGYTFKEWNTKADGSGTAYANKTSVTNLANPGATITLYAQWTINKVYIKYSVNGGKIASSATADNGTKYTWTTDSNGVISKSINGGTATNIIHTVNYGATMNSDGLANWNNSKYMNITRSGYTAASNQWKCLSGNCKKTEYNHSTAYTAAELCDASKGNCTITLGVNWVSTSSSGQSTTTKTTYYRTRTKIGTKWTASCNRYEQGAGFMEVHTKQSGLASETACKTLCNNIKLTTGYIVAECSSYTAYSNWSSWTTTKCSPIGELCESKTE